MKFTALLFLIFAVPQVFGQLSFTDGSLSLKQNEENKFGFVDRNDKWIIEPIYEDASELPSVDAAIVKVESKYRFIDPKGNFKNDWKLDEVYLSAGITELLCYAKINGKWGALDTKFAEIIPFQYEIPEYNEWINFYVDGGFSYLNKTDPLIVKKGEKYGVINSRNEILLPFEYENIALLRNFTNKIERYALKRNNKWAICKMDETKKADYRYDDYLETDDDDSIRIVNKNGQWYFLNIYTGAEKKEIGDETRIINVKKEGKWGTMNGKGELKVPFVSDWVLNHPQVYSRYIYKNNLQQDFTMRFGLLSTSGVVLLEPDYEEITPIDDMFIIQRDGFKGLISNGGTWVMPPFNQDVKHLCLDLFACKTADKYKIYNNYGANVFPSPVDEVFCTNEIMLIRKQDRWGVISKTGKILFHCIFESIGRGFENGFCIVKYEGKYGLINRFGETVVFYDYEEVHPDFDFYSTSKTEKFKLNGTWVDVELPKVYKVQE